MRPRPPTGGAEGLRTKLRAVHGPPPAGPKPHGTAPLPPTRSGVATSQLGAQQDSLAVTVGLSTTANETSMILKGCRDSRSDLDG